MHSKQYSGKQSRERSKINQRHCEICGRETEPVLCVIEGCKMSVCNSCARYGAVQAVSKSPALKRDAKMPAAETEEMVIADSAAKVKKARESRQLTQEQLAKAVAEKESVIHRIESGNMVPSMYTARKLERFLDIRLIEAVEEVKAVNVAASSEGFTIGDLLVKKK